MKNKVGALGVIILAIIPAIIWIFMQPISTRFADVPGAMRSLGQLFALAGVSLFSLSFVLSARLKILEDYFGGLDRMLSVHHSAGAVAFMLLLFHPLFLAARFLGSSLKTAALFLLPSANWPNNFGIIALFIMEVLLVITFYAKWKYNNWKFSHKFLGLAFAVAAVHVLLIPSDISQNKLLRYYILILVIAGLCAFTYKTLLEKRAVKKYDYKVKEVKKINRDVAEITLEPLGSALGHFPAQFIFVQFEDENVSMESHPFTVSSGEGEKNLRITVKNLGDYTSKIRNLREGSAVKIEGPFGRFYNRQYNSAKQVWIAGGIGITPFISMARSLSEKGEEINLYYSVREDDEAVFIGELKKIAQQNKRLKVHLHVTSEKGFLTAKSVKESTGAVSDSEILLCGPPAMMRSLREQFIALGSKNKNIHSEEFDLL